MWHEAPKTSAQSWTMWRKIAAKGKWTNGVLCACTKCKSKQWVNLIKSHKDIYANRNLKGIISSQYFLADKKRSLQNVIDRFWLSTKLRDFIQDFFTKWIFSSLLNVLLIQLTANQNIKMCTTSEGLLNGTVPTASSLHRQTIIMILLWFGYFSFIPILWTTVKVHSFL